MTRLVIKSCKLNFLFTCSKWLKNRNLFDFKDATMSNDKHNNCLI